MEGFQSRSILVEDSEFARGIVEDLCESPTYMEVDHNRDVKLTQFEESLSTKLGALMQVSQEVALISEHWLLDPITGQYWVPAELMKANRKLNYA